VAILARSLVDLLDAREIAAQTGKDGSGTEAAAAAVVEALRVAGAALPHDVQRPVPRPVGEGICFSCGKVRSLSLARICGDCWWGLRIYLAIAALAGAAALMSYWLGLLDYWE
jgi:hypothetical protein